MAIVWRAVHDQLHGVTKRERDRVDVVHVANEIRRPIAPWSQRTNGFLLKGVTIVHRDQRVFHLQRVQRALKIMRERRQQDGGAGAGALTARFADITILHADEELTALDATSLHPSLNDDLGLMLMAGDDTLEAATHRLDAMLDGSELMHDIDLDMPAAAGLNPHDDLTLEIGDDASSPFGAAGHHDHLAGGGGGGEGDGGEGLGTMLGTMGVDEAATFFSAQEPPLSLGQHIADADDELDGMGGMGGMDDLDQQGGGGFGLEEEEEEEQEEGAGGVGVQPADAAAAAAAAGGAARARDDDAAALPPPKRLRAPRRLPMVIDDLDPKEDNRRLKLWLDNTSSLVSSNPARFARPKPKSSKPPSSSSSSSSATASSRLSFDEALVAMPAEWDSGNPALREVWSLTLKLRKAHLAEKGRLLSKQAGGGATAGAVGGGGAAAVAGAAAAAAALGRLAPELEVMRDGDDGGFEDMGMPIDDALPLGFGDAEGEAPSFGMGIGLHGAYLSPGADPQMPRGASLSGGARGGSDGGGGSSPAAARGANRGPRRSSIMPGGSENARRVDEGLAEEYEYAEGFGLVRANSASAAPVRYSLGGAGGGSGGGGDGPGYGRGIDLSFSYTRSTQQLMDEMEALLAESASASVNFNDEVMPSRPTRRQQAACFVDLLTLTSDRRLSLEQARPYDDIVVGRGPAFELQTGHVPGAAQTIDEED